MFSEKTNEIFGKWAIILKTNETIEKMGRSQTINEQNKKKPNVPISSGKDSIPLKLYFFNIITMIFHHL